MTLEIVNIRRQLRGVIVEKAELTNSILEGETDVGIWQRYKQLCEQETRLCNKLLFRLLKLPEKKA